MDVQTEIRLFKLNNLQIKPKPQLNNMCQLHLELLANLSTKLKFNLTIRNVARMDKLPQ